MLGPNDFLGDLETRSRTDLKKSGARRYAADPSTQITTASWVFRGVRKNLSTVHPFLGKRHGPTAEPYALADLYNDLREAARCGGRIVFHNANFDINVLTGLNPFFTVPLSAIDCTMGRAQSLALPGGLDDLCAALGVKGKDPRGGALVMATCKPKKDGTFNEDVETHRALLEYNDEDREALMRVDELLPPLSPAERMVFERTWRKNQLGLPIDVHLATAIAIRRQEIEQESQQELMELTQNAVTKVTQRKRILDWANSGNRAAGLPGTKKHEVAEALANEDLHPDVRRVLEIVQQDGGSAPTKAQALLDRHVDCWYKDATRYFGARSGRGTSEGVNTFNIARPSGKYDGKNGRPSIEQVITELKTGVRHNNIALTDCLRGLIVAPAGWMVADNDLSNAELRLALWQAGDTERLRILAANADLYMENAIRILRLPPGSTKDTHPKERQTFKSVTLGGNYELGPKTYMAHQRREGRRIEIGEATQDIYGYRNANPLLFGTGGLLPQLKDAFGMAIYEPPGRIFTAGKVAFQKDGNGTVWMLLPSGRCIPHYNAHIAHGGDMAFFRAKYGMMLRQKAFGGSLLEISCQAMTRDIITAAEEDIERELPDCHLILDVYDSILALVPEHIAEERSEQIRQIMKRPRHWTAGLPLDCEGYVHTRMKK
jgi:DNA polymerase